MSSISLLFFELGGISVPYEANYELRQFYQEIEAAEVLRFMDGSSEKQTSFSGPLRTRIEATGDLPHALDGLDYSQQLLMKCAAPRVIGSASNVIALPGKRRADALFEPYGYAVLNGERVDMPVNLAGDIATVDFVAGATHYGVHYFPQITVWATPPESDIALTDGEFGWALEAEEV